MPYERPLSAFLIRYAAHAHHYTAGGCCLLLADVAVGNVETVVRWDAARGAPSTGFDSIVIPGRKLPSQSGPGGGREMNVEEYVIFDGVRVVTRVSRSEYRRSGAFRSCAQ